MTRGQKICRNCNASNGPRTKQCTNCGKGFIIKGVLQPDLDKQKLEYSNSRSAYNNNCKINNKILISLVDKYKGKDDKERRKKYDIKGRTWQSKDGKYRICERLTFCGVNMKDGYGKPFYIYKRGNNDWEPIKPKHRFKSLKRALLKLYEMIHNEKLEQIN